MMTPLQDSQRSQGGAARAENQSGSDRTFLATLAASRRPLKNDVPMTDDEVVEAFKQLSESGPPGGGRRWLICVIVGADGRTIRAELSPSTIRQRLKLVGGAIGFLGVVFFGGPDANRGWSVQAYYRPLKKGTGVIEKLDRAKRKVLAAVIAKVQPVVGPIDTEVTE